MGDTWYLDEVFTTIQDREASQPGGRRSRYRLTGSLPRPDGEGSGWRV